MQGTIVKVAVEEGQEVAEGDVIVVLEAMKMEQPLKAHKAGTVTGLDAEVGGIRHQRRRHLRDQGLSRLRIHVLVFDAFGGGGVARTVVNLSNHLAQRHEVELVSLFRSRRQPRFAHDPRIRLTVLHPDRAASRAGCAPSSPPGPAGCSRGR